MVTWTQLGIHSKRCGVLNVGGYYDPLLAMFEAAVREGFLTENNRSIVVAAQDPSVLLDLLATTPTPLTSKWIESGAREPLDTA